MSSGSNDVQCPNCKRSILSTADKCSYCGTRLRGVPPIVLGLAGLLILGGAYFVFKDKLFGAQSPTPIASPSSPIPNPTSLRAC